jgi:predicted HicB family RNase H-like nuclease
MGRESRAELLRAVPTSGLMARVPASLHAEIRMALLAEGMTLGEWIAESFELWKVSKKQPPTEPSGTASM